MAPKVSLWISNFEHLTLHQELIVVRPRKTKRADPARPKGPGRPHQARIREVGLIKLTPTRAKPVACQRFMAPNKAQGWFLGIDFVMVLCAFAPVNMKLAFSRLVGPEEFTSAANIMVSKVQWHDSRVGGQNWSACGAEFEAGLSFEN